MYLSCGYKCELLFACVDVLKVMYNMQEWFHSEQTADHFMCVTINASEFHSPARLLVFIPVNGSCFHFLFVIYMLQIAIVYICYSRTV